MESTPSILHTTVDFSTTLRKALVIGELGIFGIFILVFIVPVALIFLFVDALKE